MTDTRPRLHYVRVSKTASTALISALESVRDSIAYQVVIHEHEDSVLDVPDDELFFTSVRDPIARFASGFLSRQRRGRPRYNSQWNEQEAIAFEEFDHPWVLGASLSDTDPQRRARAHSAMRSIRHVCTHLSDWFIDEPTVRQVAPRCVALIHQESWDRDVATLARFLDVAELLPPRDDVGAHRNPPLRSVDAALEQQARENLSAWFAEDYQLLAEVTNTLGANNNVRPGSTGFSHSPGRRPDDGEDSPA
jgi:hypothetical protein